MTIHLTTNSLVEDLPNINLILIQILKLIS